MSRLLLPTHYARARVHALSAVLLGSLLLAAGCESVPDRLAVNPLTRSYEPTNVAGPDYLPVDVRRVALLPVWSSRPVDAQSLESLDRAFNVALTRAARFETIPVSRPQMRDWFKQASLGSTDALPANLFAQLREHLAADAVLLVDLTHYSPYPPLAIGLRTRLIRLDTGATLWATDELFDAALAATAAGARRHHLQGADGPADLSPTALQSPARFALYAADTLVGTLPAR